MLTDLEPADHAATFKPMQQERIETVEPKGSSPEERRARHWRKIALRIRALRADILVDRAVEPMDRLRRVRLLAELERCTHAFVMKQDPWRKK